MGKKDERRRIRDEGRRMKDEGEIGDLVLDIQPKVEGDQQVSESADLQIGAGIPSAQVEKPYTLGTWAGMTQWKCKLCAWDTLKGEAEMLEHVATAHKPPPPRILIADKSGNIKREA